MHIIRSKKAEDNFREAFERLKNGVSVVMPTGSAVSQNNVAREAGCDPSALRKSRFPTLVEEIQNFNNTKISSETKSERKRLLEARQASRTKSETIANLKVQRDKAVSQLVEADEMILSLTQRVKNLEAQLEDVTTRVRNIQEKNQIKPRTNLKAMDIDELN